MNSYIQTVDVYFECFDVINIKSVAALKALLSL